MNMKNVPFIAVLVFVGILASCDRVENPVVVSASRLNWDLFPDGDSTDYDWPTTPWAQNNNTFQNVLIEDYTGHTCTNCPAAAIIAKDIEDANPGRVFVASVHASTSGGFQEPRLPEFSTDFRTGAGNEYANTLGIIFNPAGTINRVLDGSNYYHFSNTWDNATTAELSNTPKANLQLQYNYFPSTRGLFIHTETEALEALSGQFNLVIYLVRNTVVAPQEEPGNTVEEYDHHSVLTDNVNGTWGTTVFDGSAAQGDKVYNDFSYAVPNGDASFAITNLSLITYICDRSTYEVLQVIKTPLQ